eukprot:TRINITY_DN6459_c0_g1_i1.p1 TRINITY_DN6459_c0_g1~~TRINITY_DN6459_c0_g1_i1.p1  ORF type:complete len:352 (-),score=50.40 TRINITY_DN6459_c0_g1_i1:8-1063(-)
MVKTVGFWNNPLIQSSFLDRIALRSNVRKWEDWYSVDKRAFLKNGGEGLLKYYNGCHVEAITSVYPQHPWKLYRFSFSNSGQLRDHWNSVSVQRQFLNDFAKKKGFTAFDEWNFTNKDEIIENGGSALLDLHSHSLLGALAASYPEHRWSALNFRHERIPQSFWANKEHRKNFVVDLALSLGIRSPHRWNQVGSAVVAAMGGRGFLEYYGNSLESALNELAPLANDSWSSILRVSKPQRELYHALVSRFPDMELNFTHAQLMHPASQKPIQFDLYSAEKNVVFEYQGEQHYRPIAGGEKEFREQQRRDAEKRLLCETHNITLVEVPYWRDRNVNSVLDMLFRSRPDLRKTW